MCDNIIIYYDADRWNLLGFPRHVLVNACFGQQRIASVPGKRTRPPGRRISTISRAIRKHVVETMMMMCKQCENMMMMWKIWDLATLLTKNRVH